MSDSIVGVPKIITASGTVTNKHCRLLGFYVNSTTAGTLVLNTEANNSPVAISGTITPAVGWNQFPAVITNGLSVTVGGTINVTFLYQDGM